MYVLLEFIDVKQDQNIFIFSFSYTVQLIQSQAKKVLLEIDLYRLYVFFSN